MATSPQSESPPNPAVRFARLAHKPRPHGIGALHAGIALVLFATVVVVSQTIATPAASGAIYITGQIAVLETPDAHYIAFQQSLTRKSNSYCADEKNTCPISFSPTPPDVRISKSADEVSVDAGGTVTYTMTVNNVGGTAAEGVAISDDLDDHLVVTSATWQVGGGGAGGTCTVGAGNTLSCEVGPLVADDGSAGGLDSVIVTVTVTAPAAACPEVTNQSHVTVTNEAVDQQTDSQAEPGDDNWSLPVDVAVLCPPPVISVSLIKTNDANGDGTYTDREVAPAQGAVVPFRAVITNLSSVPVRIDQLTDLLPGQLRADGICSNLLTTVLQPAAEATCDWLELGYAGAPGAAAKVNVAAVTVSEVGNPANTATDDDPSSVTVVVHQAGDTTNTANDDDTSTVRGVAVLGETVTKAPTELARTGSERAGVLTGLGLALIGAGMLLLVVTYGPRRIHLVAAHRGRRAR